MASSVILRNLKQLQKSLQKNIDYVDLNYAGVKTDSNGKPFIKLHYGDPILNEYKMWLRSGISDYIREPGKGGFFARNLNEYEFSPDSEEAIAADLKAKTKEIFPNINLISVEVKCTPSIRGWRVKVVVGDNITGLVSADMVSGGESIVFNVNNISED